ncbi:MAG: zinc-dependent alcohol dehydrogenase [Anaerolineae bacterium]
MRALVKAAPGPGNVEIRDLPIPQPAEDEILIHVKYCGICGTDLHIQADEFPNAPPVVMGHEFCGTVAEVGAAERGTWSVGDRVVGELHTGACGHCALCLAGKPHICDSKLALGSKHNGAFAEYLTLPAWLVHRIPEGISWEVAGVTEPFAISAHCLAERGALDAPRCVFISGSAAMGLMAAIWACRLGARSIVVSGTNLDEATRFPLARALGATHTVNVQREDLRGTIMGLTNGEGADVWIECSGSGAAITSGIGLLKKTGRAVLIGLVGTETIAIPWNTLLYKELDLSACFSSPPSAWEKALAAEPDEAPKLRKLVSDIIPLADWERGFAMMRRGEAVKILVDLEA